MITFNIANSYPMQLGVMATKKCMPIVNPFTSDFSDFCKCNCACTPIFKAFYHSDGNEYKNDKSSFLYKKAISTDTIDLRLYKDGVQVDNLNDNDYGVFYDFGSLANPNLKGYLLHWSSVYFAHGYGMYQVVATVTSLGSTFTLESDIFECLIYTNERADGTVRIETTQNGYIMSGIDYTGVNWYQQYRISGWIEKQTPEFITDNILNSKREKTQVQDQVVNSYILETELLPSSILNAIIYDGLLANKILLTDYNFCYYEQYRKLEVYPDGIDEFKTYRENFNGYAKFKFTDKQQNVIKRNYY